MVDPPEPPASPPPELPRRQLWMAYVIGAFGLAANAQAQLLVPLRARELGASFEAIGLIVAASAIGPAMFAILLGALIDRLGPRRGFILGTSMVAVVGVAYSFVTNYWLLLVLQFFFGLSRSFGWISSQAYVTNVGRPEDRATIAGKFGFFSNLGPMLGPLAAGGVAQVVGLRLAFLFLAAYALSFAVLGVFLRDTAGAARKGPSKQGVGLRTAMKLLRNQGMQVVLLLSGARLWTNWVWAAFFPVYLADSGVAVGAVGTVITVRALVSTLTAPMAGTWARRIGKQWATVIGLGCGAVGLAVSPLFTSLPGAYVASILVGIAIGLSLPLLLSIVADVVDEEQRGVALGLRVSVNQLSATAAPLLAGPLIAATGAVVGFMVSGGTAAVMVIAGVLIHRRVMQAKHPV